MNKEAIKVGDVYRVNEWLAVVISIDPNLDVNRKMNILIMCRGWRHGSKNRLVCCSC